MDGIRIGICDDEREQIARLRELVFLWARQKSVVLEIRSFSSAEAFLFAGEQFDILLLDIQMGGQNGVELARQIRKDNEAVQIVFITGFPDFIAEGYEVSALHYLMKPVNSEKLSVVLDRALAKVSHAEPMLLFEAEGEHVRVPQKDIFYIEVLWPVVKIATVGDEYEVRGNLSDIEAQLEPHAFVRCHRSYIAGLRHVSRLTRTEIILDDNRSIPLSRRLYHEVHQAFVKYYRRDTD